MTEKPIILFDGVCNLCNGAVTFTIKHDRKENFLFTSLQSQAGQQLLKKFNLPLSEFNSFILIDGERIYTRSTAALRVCKSFSGALSLLYVFIVVPSPIRDFVYKIISKNRYKWFGKKESCMIPTPELKKRFLD